MKKKLKRLILRRGFEFSIYTILVVLVLNSLLILRYRQMIKENVTLKEDLLAISMANEGITASINRADMALRGYLLVPEESMVAPFYTSVTSMPGYIQGVESFLAKYGYDISKMQAGKKALTDYMSLVSNMVEMAKNGNADQALEILKTDPGYAAWETYYPMQSDLTAFVNELNAKANGEYTEIIRNTRISQIIVIVLSIPFLIAIGRRLRVSQLNRKKLFATLNENRKRYLFDERADEEMEVNENTVINGLVTNLEKASHFINNITDGNYNISWEGLDKENWKYNENNLSGELTKMRDQMIKVKKEDEKRLWMTEGLSKFGEIIRNYQNNLGSLSDHLISELIKYLGAKQGGIFILNDDNKGEEYLELTGCYAYERKKFLEKRIEPGDGLVGQCYLEKEYIYLKNIPQDYVKITSGLGETNPSSLLLVPLKNESVVIGVLEIASLNAFEDYQIDFVNQLSESMASAIQNVKINENTSALLERTQQQAEEMRAQEEEMRQNMEELQATQESLNRESKEKEKVQHEIEKTKNFLQSVINALPDPIFVKDQDHKFVILNDAVCEFNGWNRDEVLGKSDFDFFPKSEAELMYNDEEEILRSKKDVQKEMEATRHGEKTYVIDKKRVIEDEDGKKFIVGINIDISQLKKVEKDLAKEKYLLDAMLDNIPDSIYFKDDKSRFIRVSKSMVSSFGFNSSEELMGKTDFDFQDKEHAQQAFDDEMNIIKTEKPLIDVVEKETFEDGSVRWVSTTKMPLRDLDNNVVGTFGISRDVTPVKKLEIDYQMKLERTQKELEEKDKELKKLKAK